MTEPTVAVYCDEARRRGTGRHDVAPQWRTEPTGRVVFKCCGLNYVATTDRWASIQAQLAAAGVTEISLLNLARFA